MTAKEWGRLVQADRPLSFSCLRFVSCLLLDSPGWIYNTGPRQSAARAALRKSALPNSRKQAPFLSLSWSHGRRL